MESQEKKSRGRFLKKPFSWFAKTRKRNKIIVIILTIIIVILVTAQIQSANKKPGFILAKVTKSTITEEVTETGTIDASGRTDIFSPSTGIIDNIFVKNGEAVKIGQELFTIKSSATEQEKAQALSNYLTAKSTLDSARANLYSLQSDMFSKWDTYKNLAEGDAYENSDGSPKTNARTLPEFHIAEKDWLASEASYKKQQAVISQAQAAVSSTWLLYQATQNITVKANADGQLSNISVRVGSSVKAYTASSPSQALATIANLITSEEAVISFSENDIAKIHEGQKVIVDVKAVDNKKYRGIVRRVDAIGNLIDGVIRYKAYIEILDGDENLRHGMNVDVAITTKKVKNVLSVPNSAIKPYKGGHAVRILNQKTNQIKYIPVTIGIRGEEKTQIIRGLSEGTSVITSLSNEQIKRSGLFGG